MNTENEQNLLTNQEPEVNELYLRYFDEEINFGGANGSSRSQFEGNSSMTFDNGPLAEFPSPPGLTLFTGPETPFPLLIFRTAFGCWCHA